MRRHSPFKVIIVSNFLAGFRVSCPRAVRILFGKANGIRILGNSVNRRWWRHSPFGVISVSHFLAGFRVSSPRAELVLASCDPPPPPLKAHAIGTLLVFGFCFYQIVFFFAQFDFQMTLCKLRLKVS